MAVLDRVKRLFGRGRTTPDEVSSPFRVFRLGQMPAGVRMTPDEALRLSALWACVTVIAKALASSAWNVYSEAPNGNRDLRRDHPVCRILDKRPNLETTAFSFKEAALIQALVWGNFFAEIERDIAGRPVALWPIMPERITFERDYSTRQLVVRVNNYAEPDAVLPYRDVFHLHGPGIDALSGFETVTVAARSLAHAAAAEVFGASFYGNGAQMGGILSTDANLAPEKVQELRTGIEARHGGPDRAHKFLLLTGGLKYQQTSVAQDAAQFIESRQFLVEETCRWFGVPPHKIAHLLRATFSNIEHQNLEFSREALRPWARRMCEEADAKLFPPSNRMFSTEFDLDWLVEGDAQSRATADSTLVNNGIMTRNEVRRKRGLNTVGPEGDVLTVQEQYQPLGRVGVDTPGDDGEQDSDADTLAPIRAHLEDVAIRCVAREEKRAESALQRYTGDRGGFVDWLDTFFAQHRDYMANALERPIRSLEQACGTDPIHALMTIDDHIQRTRLGFLETFDTGAVWNHREEARRIVADIVALEPMPAATAAGGTHVEAR